MGVRVCRFLVLPVVSGLPPLFGCGRQPGDHREADVYNETDYPFPHQKLDAWRVALELATRGRALARLIPVGDRDLAAQLRRSSAAAVLLIGEGAGRRGSRRVIDKRRA